MYHIWTKKKDIKNIYLQNLKKMIAICLKLLAEYITVLMIMYYNSQGFQNLPKTNLEQPHWLWFAFSLLL